MSTYALISNKKVINMIAWDGPEVSPMDFDDGVTAVKVPTDDGTYPSFNWSYENGKFTAPPLTDEEIEERKRAAIEGNLGNKQSLMNEASAKISVLQDAVDLDMATDEEARLLPLWKKYRVNLNRIDANTDSTIDWPAKPV